MSISKGGAKNTTQRKSAKIYSMLNLPKEYIIFDMEWTTWEGAQERKWGGPNEYREITQIGAILVDGETLEEKAHSLLFVKPVKNPIVSEFFTKLTGITQQEIDEKGMTLPAALAALKTFAGDREFYCFGSDGKRVMENCALLEIQSPFPAERFHNVKEVFQANGIDTTGYMSSTITQAFGVEPDRHAHDGLSDSRSILDALRLLVQQKKTQ